MDDWIRGGVEAEARRICHDQGITDYEAFRQIAHGVAHRQFMQAIEPMIRQKVRILALRIPARIVMKDGALAETEYLPLHPDADKTLALLDELIDEERKRFGLTLS